MLFVIFVPRCYPRYKDYSTNQLYDFIKLRFTGLFVLSLILLITSLILFLVHTSFVAYLIVFLEGVVEMLIALVYYIRMKCLKRDNVIVVDQTISLESGRASHPNDESREVSQPPLIT